MQTQRDNILVFAIAMYFGILVTPVLSETIASSIKTFSFHTIFFLVALIPSWKESKFNFKSLYYNSKVDKNFGLLNYAGIHIDESIHNKRESALNRIKTNKRSLRYIVQIFLWISFYKISSFLLLNKSILDFNIESALGNIILLMILTAKTWGQVMLNIFLGLIAFVLIKNPDANLFYIQTFFFIFLFILNMSWMNLWYWSKLNGVSEQQVFKLRRILPQFALFLLLFITSDYLLKPKSNILTFSTKSILTLVTKFIGNTVPKTITKIPKISIKPPRLKDLAKEIPIKNVEDSISKILEQVNLLPEQDLNLELSKLLEKMRQNQISIDKINSSLKKDPNSPAINLSELFEMQKRLSIKFKNTLKRRNKSNKTIEAELLSLQKQNLKKENSWESLENDNSINEKIKRINQHALETKETKIYEQEINELQRTLENKLGKMKKGPEEKANLEQILNNIKTQRLEKGIRDKQKVIPSETKEKIKEKIKKKYSRLFFLILLTIAILFFLNLRKKGRVRSKLLFDKETKEQLVNMLALIRNKFPTFEEEVIYKYKFVHSCIGKISFNLQETPPAIPLTNELPQETIMFKDQALRLGTFFNRVNFDMAKEKFTKKEQQLFKQDFKRFVKDFKILLKESD